MPKVLLLYFAKESSNAYDAEEFLGNFVPVYVEDAIVIPEVRAIAESMKGNPADSVRKQIFKYLTQEYATPQPNNLDEWLKSRHLLAER